MASSQDIAKWVEGTLNSFDWISINQAILDAIKSKIPNASESFQYDLLEKEELYVETILRDNLANIKLDGGITTYEIDENEPYIKSINKVHLELLEKLRKIDPFKFEVICKLILEKVGGESGVTPKTHDGGVDFYSLNLRHFGDQFLLPITSSISVFGQAKRFKDGNEITESDLRKFVGGALLKIDEFRDGNKINVLSPIIFAFWTTSSFHAGAKEYSKRMGIWYMDGITITDYLIKLELTSEIEKQF